MSLTREQLDSFACGRFVNVVAQEAYERGAWIAHYARKHADGDPMVPCLIEHPTGYASCGGPQEHDVSIARAFLFAGWLSPELDPS